MHRKIEIGIAKDDLKFEDVLLVRTKVRFRIDSSEPQNRGRSGAPASVGDPNVYNLLCVFDGHNGGKGAVFLQTNLEKVLHERMPFGPCPGRDDPRWKPFRTQIQKALVETVAVLESDFAKQGLKDGSTLTIIVLTGTLVTCINVGDSRAYLDTGESQPLQITADHRIAVNKRERHRLEGLGCRVAPLSESSACRGPGEGEYAQPGEKGYGPLRVWPGGLCLSRSFGDFDVGEGVLCFPHVYQVLVPEEGGRLVVASDGLWDAFPKTAQWLRHLRHGTPESAAKKLIACIKAAYEQKLKDDTTIIIADILPQNVGYFPEVLVNYKAPPQGCFGCCAPPDDDSCKAPTPRILTDLDIAAVLGLVPGAEIRKIPDWFTPQFAEDLKRRAAQVYLDYRAAVGIHEEADADEFLKKASLEAEAPPDAIDSPRAHPRRHRHVRFAEEEPIMEIPAVYGGEEALRNGSLGAHSPPPVWGEAGGESRVPQTMLDVSTRLGNRFYDSVPEGQMAARPASLTKGSLDGGSQSPQESVAGRSPDRLVTGRIRDTDPSVRAGMEFLRGDSGGGPPVDEEPLSYSVKNTDPTVRMGSNFRSPNRRGSPLPGTGTPVPYDLQDISTRLLSRTSAAQDDDGIEGAMEKVSKSGAADGVEAEGAPRPQAAGAHLDEEDFYPSEPDSGGDVLRQNASHHFPSSVVDDPADYAARLGRYRNEVPNEEALTANLQRPSLLHRISRQVDAVFSRRSQDSAAALSAKLSNSSSASAPGSVYSKVDSTRTTVEPVPIKEVDEHRESNKVGATAGSNLAKEPSSNPSAADNGSDMLKKNASVHFPQSVAEDPADYALRLGPYRNEASALEASDAKLQRPSMLQRLSRQVELGFKRNSQQSSPAPDAKPVGSVSAPQQESHRPPKQESHRPPPGSPNNAKHEGQPPSEKVSPSPYSSSVRLGEEARVRDGRAVMAAMRSTSFPDQASTSSEAFPDIVAGDNNRPKTAASRAVADGGASLRKNENQPPLQPGETRVTGRELALDESSSRELRSKGEGLGARASKRAASGESGLQEPGSRDASQRSRADSKASEQSSPDDSAHAAGRVPPVARLPSKPKSYVRSQWSMM